MCSSPCMQWSIFPSPTTTWFFPLFQSEISKWKFYPCCSIFSIVCRWTRETAPALLLCSVACQKPPGRIIFPKVCNLFTFRFRQHDHPHYSAAPVTSPCSLSTSREGKDMTTKYIFKLFRLSQPKWSFPRQMCSRNVATFSPAQKKLIAPNLSAELLLRIQLRENRNSLRHGKQEFFETFCACSPAAFQRRCARF